MSEFVVSELNIRPVKSCGPMQLITTGFDELGMSYSRNWMFIDGDNKFVSHARFPELTSVGTHVDEDGLTLFAPRQESFYLPHEEAESSEVVPVDFYNKIGSGVLVSAEADKYMSEYLGTDVRLLRVHDAREIKKECQVEGASKVTGFADGFPLHIVNRASLDKLNQDLVEPISIDRFAADIVVEPAEPFADEENDAYEEDHWREIVINDTRIWVVRATARCSRPNIINGEIDKRNQIVTKALRKTRLGIDPINGEKGWFFGVYATHEYDPSSSISVGDSVEILDRSADPNFIPT